MKTKILIGLSALSLATAALAVNEPAIIPQPQSLARLEGFFKLAESTTIYTDTEAAETGRMLAGKIRQATGWQLRVSSFEQHSSSVEAISRAHQLPARCSCVPD